MMSGVKHKCFFLFISNDSRIFVQVWSILQLSLVDKSFPCLGGNVDNREDFGHWNGRNSVVCEIILKIIRRICVSKIIVILHQVSYKPGNHYYSRHSVLRAVRASWNRRYTLVDITTFEKQHFCEDNLKKGNTRRRSSKIQNRVLITS
jgi:hypothetical protein